MGNRTSGGPAVPPVAGTVIKAYLCPSDPATPSAASSEASPFPRGMPPGQVDRP
jgi:hypothetical protein